MITESILINLKKSLKQEENETAKIIEFETGIDKLEEWGALSLFLHFNKNDIFTDQDEIYDISSIQHKLYFLPKYSQFLSGVFELFVRRGFIREIQTQIYEVNPDKKVTSLNLKGCLEKIVLEYPSVKAHAVFLDKVISVCFDVMRGRKDFLSVMFPEGDFDIVDALYKQSPSAAYFNYLLSLAVKGYAETHIQQDGSFSIVEIGAGIGSSTEYIFNENIKYSDYLYTDISKAFIKKAEAKFKSTNSLVSFQTLNIDKDVELQGVCKKYDVVIAANVLHASKSVTNALYQVKKLLKPGGVLILNEGIEKKDFSTLAYGLLDSWWSFEDTAYRIPFSPFVSWENWFALLYKAGFCDVISVKKDVQIDALFYQDIIIATLAN